MLKLDIEKAFDTVSWEFLLEILAARGFGQKWRDWIAILLGTASTRILVNGELTDPILHGRGLRQGDPISPLLFVIVMDVLARLIAAANRQGILNKIGNRELHHRISLYADDVILFANPNLNEIDDIKNLLQLFGEATWLHANFAKSSITPIHCQDIDLSQLTSAFGCPVQEFPCTYLGMPLSDKRLRKVDLQPALDKIKSKAKGWKLGHFGFDGTLILVKHVLSAMHTFQMLALAMPVWLSKAIDKCRRSFLWAQDEIANGGKCLVKWSSVPTNA
ncbi:hypothetical protein ACQ4PT_011473 [Festuca glaucescens]